MGAGSLEVRSQTLIRAKQPPTQLINAIKRTGELTIEAWITPQRTDQTGPARIVTLSKDTNARNFTLGQDKDRFDVRLRASGTDANGMPSISSRSGTVVTKPTHVVYTRERSGVTRVFINGKESGTGKANGNLGNWDGSYSLALANELTKDRPWLGTYHFVAIFDRAHNSAEVQQNFAAGLPSIKAISIAQTPPAEPKEITDREPSGTRIAAGLQVLYDFAETDGNLIRDRAGVGKPINLKIADPKSVRRRMAHWK